MKLSHRLSEIYDMLEQNSNVADIGADHGQLIIEFAKQNKNSKLFCNDNKVGPFTILKTNISKYNLTNVEVSLSSGISALPDYINCVVIAGMGADLIVKILNDGIDKLKNVETLVLAPNANAKEVRKFVTSIGYYIVSECIIFEKHYYEIIKFKKGQRQYDDLDYEFGPILRKEKCETFKNKYLEDINALKELLHKNLPTERKEEVLNQLERIKSL